MKNVLITGGASGMGRATAVKLAQNGYHVFSCDIKTNSEECENITQLVMDVTKSESVEKAYEFVSSKDIYNKYVSQGFKFVNYNDISWL